ncbi:MAG: hypothetical protein LC749_03620 [Actinobacteria bacterium]|nr:hypothetical protein [Actinomycetota bacterium]
MPPADYLTIRPGARDSRELSDLAARVNWYLPDVRIPVVLARPDGAEVDASHAQWMDPDLVRAPAWLSAPPPGRSHEVFHRLGPSEALSVLRRGRASVIAAPELSSAADLGWIWLRWHFASMSGHSSPVATERFFDLGGRGNSAYVMATGPTARLVDPATVSAEVRIVCNSAVRDLDLLRLMKPNIICFVDPVFHYGPNRYAAAFRRDLLRAVDETDALIVTFDLWAGLLRAHHPQLADRIVMLRPLKGKPAWHWPTREDRMTVRLTGNVLTDAMLPVAFALCDRVEIAGCDGRHRDDNYFWRHNARTQYSDELMATVFDAHPAFFRDRDYADYYKGHCKRLEDLLVAGEQAGKRVIGVTPSHIPALRRRGAPALHD